MNMMTDTGAARESGRPTKSPATGRKRAVGLLPNRAMEVMPASDSSGASRRRKKAIEIVIERSGSRLPSSPTKSASHGGGEVRPNKAHLGHVSLVLADLLREITADVALRRDFLVPEGDMTRRIKAKHRTFAYRRLKAAGKIKEGQRKFPKPTQADIAGADSEYKAYYLARAALTEAKNNTERELLRCVARLPQDFLRWVDSVRGFGRLSAAQILAELGVEGLLTGPRLYTSKSQIFKRMGLARVQMPDGSVETQGRRQGKEAAELHGFNPRRRSTMFVIGNNLVNQNDGEYRALYDDMKRRETEKATSAGLTVRPANKIPKGKAAAYRSEMHIHIRAKRYIEKRLLKNLWQAWRRAMASLPDRAIAPLPSASTSKKAA